jgi:hypothetical protein
LPEKAIVVSFDNAFTSPIRPLGRARAERPHHLDAVAAADAWTVVDATQSHVMHKERHVDTAPEALR